MLLQGGEVCEGIDLIQFTGVDQAHEHVTHLGPIGILVEVSVLAVKNSLFQSPFTDSDTVP